MKSNLKKLANDYFWTNEEIILLWSSCYWLNGYWKRSGDVLEYEHGNERNRKVSKRGDEKEVRRGQKPQAAPTFP